jgi:uncharacterized protein YkwD
MRSSSAADARRVPRLRSTLGALALVVCLSAAATAGTSVAGATTAQHSAHRTRAHRTDRRRRHHVVRCAKRSSFHSRGGHVPHKHHRTSCSKRGSGKRGGQGKQGGGSNHTKSGKRTGHHAKQQPSGGVKRAAAEDSCPGADLRPEQENIEALRTATLCLINRERVIHGEQPLRPNAHLQQSAQAHTESMAFGDYFEHDGPAGDTPLSRMIAAGYIYSSQIGYEIGENIGWGTVSLSTPRAIVAAWMASPGHRANILDPNFRDTAVGVSPHIPSSLAEGQPGGIYTQDFGIIITG